jgi:AhpD family alkylhydroperoxidase
MATTNRELLKELGEAAASLRAAQPDVWRGFGQMHQAALADGAIPARTKELIALAISVAKQCDGCIAHHAQAAARKGATAAEVAEALGVALMMDGGPGSVYAPRAWAAYREFAPEDTPDAP